MATRKLRLRRPPLLSGLDRAPVDEIQRARPAQLEDPGRSASREAAASRARLRPQPAHVR